MALSATAINESAFSSLSAGDKQNKAGMKALSYRPGPHQGLSEARGSGINATSVSD